MLKLAHIITKSEIGGAQTWVKDQISLFDNVFDNYIITNNPGWLTDGVNVSDVLFCKGMDSGFSIRILLKILDFIKKNEVSVIVASSANAGVYARLISIFYDCRVIYVSHGWSCIYNGGNLSLIFCLVERALSFLTDKVVCVSKKDKYNAINVIGINSRKVVYIRNCVFPRSIIKSDLDDSRFKILFLGRLDEPKRPELLIEAVKYYPNVSLDIVGDGPLKEICNKYDNINFLGAIEDFNDFSNYDLFALISDSEGMPMSALEAASAGIPLLLSNVGGCSELITGNGALVENDVDAIKQKIEFIIKNYMDFKCEALRCSEDFDINKAFNRYKELYLGCEVDNNE